MENGITRTKGSTTRQNRAYDLQKRGQKLSFKTPSDEHKQSFGGIPLCPVFVVILSAFCCGKAGHN
jgi:hypothetical protein